MYIGVERIVELARTNILPKRRLSCHPFWLQVHTDSNYPHRFCNFPGTWSVASLPWYLSTKGTSGTRRLVLLHANDRWGFYQDARFIHKMHSWALFWPPIDWPGFSLPWSFQFLIGFGDAHPIIIPFQWVSTLACVSHWPAASACCMYEEFEFQHFKIPKIRLSSVNSGRSSLMRNLGIQESCSSLSNSAVWDGRRGWPPFPAPKNSRTSVNDKISPPSRYSSSQATKQPSNHTYPSTEGIKQIASSWHGWG